MTLHGRQSAETILTFWFGDLDSQADFDRDKNGLWWAGGADSDAEIRDRFGDLTRAALAEELEPWKAEPRSCLALILLLDQFTRSLGRGGTQAFAGDAAALGACLTAIERRQDRALRLIERGFFYMPMMHAEDRDVARRSVETFKVLSEEIKAMAGGGFPDFSMHAFQHAEIIERFGRYPHRNALLGREPTADEEEFLASGGSTFGQASR